jgi:hypothetical protein
MRVRPLYMISFRVCVRTDGNLQVRVHLHCGAFLALHQEG